MSVLRTPSSRVGRGHLRLAKMRTGQTRYCWPGSSSAANSCLTRIEMRAQHCQGDGRFKATLSLGGRTVNERVCCCGSPNGGGFGGLRGVGEYRLSTWTPPGGPLFRLAEQTWAHEQAADLAWRARTTQAWIHGSSLAPWKTTSRGNLTTHSTMSDLVSG